MKHEAKRISRYHFTAQHKLFLDTNIWMFLYGPKKPRNRSVRIYSNVYNRILNAGSQIYIDVLVVSEFINRCARQECELAGYTPKQFKVFRNSSDFKSVAQGIAAAVKKITNRCLRTESTFSTLKIDGLLNDYAKGNSDFNDQVITEICKCNGLTLITDDGDFKTQEIPILTANNKLLKS